MHNTDLIGSAEAAEVCGVDRATFNRWAADGRIKPVGSGRGRTGTRLYLRAHVEEIAADKREEDAAKKASA